MRRFQDGPCLPPTAASPFRSHILAGCKRHTTIRYEAEVFTKRDGDVTPISQAGRQVPERWDVSSSAAYPVPAPAPHPIDAVSADSWKKSPVASHAVRLLAIPTIWA